MAPNKAFVSIATGTQGGAVARQLRALGWEVHAVSRDLSSPAAQALTAIGVRVHQGSLGDRSVLEAVLAGANALYLAQVPRFDNPIAEYEEGQTVLRIAYAAGVKHVIYSSAQAVPNIDPNHLAARLFKPKFDLEDAVAASSFPRWTILRPTTFMTNFVAPKVNGAYPGAADTGLFQVAFRPTTEIAVIDPEDIGAFAVAALREPEKFHGQTITLASEKLPAERIFETIRRGTGRNIRARYLSDEEVVQALPTQPRLFLHQLLRDHVPEIDPVKEAAKWGVPTGTFEGFVEREKALFEETYGSVEKI